MLFQLRLHIIFLSLKQFIVTYTSVSSYLPRLPLFFAKYMKKIFWCKSKLTVHVWYIILSSPPSVIPTPILLSHWSFQLYIHNILFYLIIAIHNMVMLPYLKYPILSKNTIFQMVLLLYNYYIYFYILLKQI